VIATLTLGGVIAWRDGSSVSQASTGRPVATTVPTNSRPDDDAGAERTIAPSTSSSSLSVPHTTTRGS
jgi:hypothetical protein